MWPGVSSGKLMAPGLLTSTCPTVPHWTTLYNRHVAELMTVKEAAAYLKVSRMTLYTLMSTGRLRWVEVEGVRGRRFRREDLDRLVREGKR